MRAIEDWRETEDSDDYVQVLDWGSGWDERH